MQRKRLSLFALECSSEDTDLFRFSVEIKGMQLLQIQRELCSENPNSLFNKMKTTYRLLTSRPDLVRVKHRNHKFIRLYNTDLKHFYECINGIYYIYIGIDIYIDIDI